MRPIWQGLSAAFGGDSIPFTVSVDGLGDIYAGTAVKPAGEAVGVIEARDILANYFVPPFISDDIRAIDDKDLVQNLPHVLCAIKSGGSPLTSQNIVPDWSYEKTTEDYGEGDILSRPVTGEIDVRMPLVVSFQRETGLGGDLVFGDWVIPAGVGGGWIAARRLPVGEYTVTMGGKGRHYKVIESCARYALYYRNAHGGWDALLMKGASSVQDSVARSTMRRSDSIAPGARGLENYHNQITRAVTLRTGLLTDLQSLRMHHLLESTDVLLYDMAEGKTWAVTLSDTTVDHKTFKSNGRKLIEYTITATIAQNFERR